MRSNVAPGGWVEFQDYDLMPKGDDDTVQPDDEVVTWESILIGAGDNIGREPSPGPKLEKWVTDAGFVNITHRVFKLPCGTWPKDKRMNMIGGYMLTNVLEGLDGFSLRLLCGVLGWTIDDAHTLMDRVRKRLLARNWHGYWPL